MWSQNVRTINLDTGTGSPPQPDTHHQGTIIKQHILMQIWMERHDPIE